MKTIKQRTPTATGEGLPESMHPVLKRVYQNRGIEGQEALERGLKGLQPYTSLSGIESATTLLVDALNQQQAIVIVGDFDADGATSTAVAVRALTMMGAKNVHYLVPNRFEYGYGLTPEIVDVALQYKPDVIITVDNGISSIDGVAHAKAQGIKVCITDHHLPGNSLPEADAIVNPNCVGDKFPSKNLAGVGVIFYLMLALRAALRDSHWFIYQGIKEPNLASLLDLVALGTVADVVPLDANNRILVHQGLLRIRKGQCSDGIRALIYIAGRQPHNIHASDLGFALGPRLNAAGRMDDMSIGIQCLLSNRSVNARALAKQLDELNKERRAIEEEMKNDAVILLDQLSIDEQKNMFGVALYDESWHQGVIGILASRIKEKLSRPVVAFAHANGSELKGSGRSVSGLHLRDVLERIHQTHPGLILKFGGHAMAAGLSIEASNFDVFAKAFNQAVADVITKEQLVSEILSDGELTQGEFTLAFAEMLKNAGPWGQGFEEPIFDGEFKVIKQNILAKKHLKLHLEHPHSGQYLEAIYFNAEEDELGLKYQTVKLAYQLDINEYLQQRRLQLIVRYIAPVGVMSGVESVVG